MLSEKLIFSPHLSRKTDVATVWFILASSYFLMLMRVEAKIETSIQIPAIHYKAEFIAPIHCEIWVGRKIEQYCKMCQLSYMERSSICGKYTYQKA